MGVYGNYGYGDYGYSGYPGYNQQNGSMLGNTSMSQAFSQLAVSPNLEASNVDNITRGVSETYNRALQPPKKKGLFGKIGDFFKGIVKGFTNLVKSLADPKTWLLIAGMVALCMLVPGAGTALMMLGIGLAGLQIFKGISSGNAEQVGEGTFNLGLAFVGGKSSGTGIKAGKGKEAVSFSRAGTRVADAEKKLAAAQKSKESKKIASAEKELQSAREAQAHAQLRMLSKDDVTTLKNNPKFSKLDTVDSFKVPIESASKTIITARKSVQEAKNAVDKAKKTEDATALTLAENHLAAQEAALSAARKNLNELYMGQRLLKVKEAGKPGLMTKTKNYLRSAKTSAGEHMMIFMNKPLTSVDGRTITYWSRTPKKNPAAAEDAASLKKNAPWYKPTWFRSNRKTDKAPGQLTEGKASNMVDESANAKHGGTADNARVTKSETDDMKNWAIVPYNSPARLPVNHNSPAPSSVGLWGKTKDGLREHGLSSFLHANMVDDMVNPFFIKMGLPEQGLLG